MKAMSRNVARAGSPLTTVSVGDRVYWVDPDEGLASGSGTVTRVNLYPGDPVEADTVISLGMDDGGEAEVLIGELRRIRPAYQDPSF